MRYHPGHFLLPARLHRRGDHCPDQLLHWTTTGRWSVEFTDDPHPRNVYWEMWGLPMFDLKRRRRRADGGPTPAGRRTRTTTSGSTPTTLRPGPGRQPPSRSSCNGPRLSRDSGSTALERADRRIRLTPPSPTRRSVLPGNATARTEMSEIRHRDPSAGPSDSSPDPMAEPRPDAEQDEPGRGACSEDAAHRPLRGPAGVRRQGGTRPCLTAELVGLKPVKTRIAEIAALLLVDRMRARYGVDRRHSPPCT